MPEPWYIYQVEFNVEAKQLMSTSSFVSVRYSLAWILEHLTSP